MRTAVKIMHRKNIRRIGKAHPKKSDIALGILFTAVYLASSLVYFNQKLWYEFFWLSNHWALMNAIGFLARSRFVLSYIVVLGIVPELIWVADFLSMLAGQPFMGITNYWFEADYPVYLKITALQHLLNPFASIYGVVRFGFHKKAWLGAAVHGAALFIASLFLEKGQNVNCAWKSCFPLVQMPSFVWQALLISAISLHIFLLNSVLSSCAKSKGIKKKRTASA